MVSHLKLAVYHLAWRGIIKWEFVPGWLYWLRKISFPMEGIPNGMLKLLFAYFTREGVHELKSALCVSLMGFKCC